MMKDKVVTEKFEIPLSGVETNFTEENPRFKDSIWTKYTLPFKIYYDRNFLSTAGHYSSMTSAELQKKYQCSHVFEGKIMKGELQFTDIKKKYAVIQIDSGFEELPNFEKKLKELPLEFKMVNDIYSHANEIVTKKYPETNYNFPKLYTTEFDLENEAWKYFNSFINYRKLNSATNTKEFPRNEIQENNNGWDVVNRNILHPLPYILHILNVGFKDAGFILTGDILEDPVLKQRCLFSPDHYHTTGEQEYQKSSVFVNEFYDNDIVAGNVFGHWIKKFKINAPGKYRIIGKCFTNFDGNSSLEIKRDGVAISSYGSGTTNSYLNFDKIIEVGIDDAEDSPEISLEFFGQVFYDIIDAEGVNKGIADIKINPMRQNTLDGEPIPFVFNFNRVDLKKAVPDLTFGELVNFIKNLRNYDLTFENNTAIMNRIVIDKNKEPEDFIEYEVEDPDRSRNEKTSFNIKFPEVEGVDLPSVFFDENGYQLNKKEIPKDTTEIQINGFGLPLENFRAVRTAKVFSETNSFMLVYYDGLDENGDNHAKNPDGLHGIAFAENVKDWFLNRLRNWTFKWPFKILKSKLRKFNIRTEIFAYNKKHLIKSWVKNSESEEYYTVDIETETY